MEYDNRDRGVLFKNHDKQEDAQPDYRGRLNVDGVDYWLSAWIKTSREGSKFMSLSVRPKETKPAKNALTPSKRSEAMAAGELDDENPVLSRKRRYSPP